MAEYFGEDCEYDPVKHGTDHAGQMLRGRAREVVCPVCGRDNVHEYECPVHGKFPDWKATPDV